MNALTLVPRVCGGCPGKQMPGSKNLHPESWGGVSRIRKFIESKASPPLPFPREREIRRKQGGEESPLSPVHHWRTFKPEDGFGGILGRKGCSVALGDGTPQLYRRTTRAHPSKGNCKVLYKGLLD